MVLSFYNVVTLYLLVDECRYTYLEYTLFSVYFLK